MKKVILFFSLPILLLATLFISIDSVNAETVPYSYTYEYKCGEFEQYPTSDGNQIKYCQNSPVYYDSLWTIDIDLLEPMNILLNKDTYVLNVEDSSYYTWILEISFKYSEDESYYSKSFDGFDSISSISTQNITTESKSTVITHTFENQSLPSSTSFEYMITPIGTSNFYYILLDSIKLTMLSDYYIEDQDPSSNENEITGDPINNPTEEESPDVPNVYSFRENIPLSDISISNDMNSMVLNTNLLSGEEYSYSINLANTIELLKTKDIYVSAPQPNNYYEWYFRISFKIPENPINYTTRIYGFVDFFDLLSVSEHPEYDVISKDLTTVYYDYRKDLDTQEMSYYASVGSNLGYTSIPDYISFNNLFTSQSGTEDNYELDSVELVLTGYNQPKVSAGSEYSLLTDELNKDLPISTERIELLDEDSHSWRIHFVASGKEFSYDTTIPISIYSTDDLLSMSLDQFYTLVISYYNPNTSLPENKLLLLIRSDIEDTSPIELNALGYPSPKELEKYIVLNLTDKIFVHSKQLKINGVVNKESNFNAYLYTSIPIDFDDLLSIRLNFDYRYNYVFSSGDWTNIENVYQKDETYNTAPPRWLWWLSLTAVTIPYEIVDSADIYDINQVTAVSELDEDIVELFESKLDYSSEDLASTSINKIHLGQYRDTFSIGYDIDNVIVINLTYAEKGQIYEVPYSLIESNVYEPEPSGSALDNIVDGLDSSDGDSWFDGLPELDIVPDSVINSIKTIFILFSLIIILWIIKKVTHFIKAFK